MRALIVVAHPEPSSFNQALARTAEAALVAGGWVIERTDLYAMDFAPVVSRRDFTTVHDAGRFNVSLEQRHALTHAGLAADVGAELDKLRRADLLILQFPLWWFGLPAILKGWIDRVFVSGAVYSRREVFDHGRLRGKRAMACVTTGAPAAAFGPDGLYGEMQGILAPLHRGVFGFTGMTVLPPYVCHHVPYEGDAARAAMLAGYREHVERLDTLVPLPMPRLADHAERLGETLRARAR